MIVRPLLVNKRLTGSIIFPKWGLKRNHFKKGVGGCVSDKVLGWMLANGTNHKSKLIQVVES